VIISTGSKALQDQLYSRDLPTVAKALKYTGKLALLKGRSNYLCLERLEQQALAGGDLPVQTLSDVIFLRSWSNQTEDGDISTCASVAEDSQAWPLVTSTNDNCLGSDCPLYKDCFVVKARKGDGCRRGGGQPPSVPRRYGGQRERFAELIPKRK
jgi:ATP-dependent DNA helicase DinG